MIERVAPERKSGSGAWRNRRVYGSSVNEYIASKVARPEQTFSTAQSHIKEYRYIVHQATEREPLNEKERRGINNERNSLVRSMTL